MACTFVSPKKENTKYFERILFMPIMYMVHVKLLKRTAILLTASFTIFIMRAKSFWCVVES